MGKKLASHVHVVDDQGAAHVFGPDDEVPGWAQEKITNESAWVDDGQGDESEAGGGVSSLSAAQPLEAEPQPAEPAEENQSGSRRRR